MTASDEQNPKKLLRAPEVAGILGMAEKTVYNRTYDGRIPSVRISASGGPRYEPLVIQAIREGATTEQVKEVAAAVERHEPDSVVLAIWRSAPAKVLPLAPRGSAKRGGGTKSGPPGGAA